MEEYILHGPIGAQAYRDNAPVAPNDPEYALKQIEQAFGQRSDNSNAPARAERKEMWNRLEGLKEALRENPKVDPLNVVYEYLKSDKEKFPYAAAELPTQSSGLGLHLKEITEFQRSFFTTAEGKSRFPELVNDRQAWLMANVAAPMHDVLKYLGSPKAQVMPDHEVMTAQLLREIFEGCTIEAPGQILAGTNKEAVKLSAEDVEFVAKVIGDHENINKELGRSEWVHSDSAVDRAKAMFFVADTLTGVIVPDGHGDWRMDSNQLNSRFEDLYFRHIDPVKGKIFRPEWGLKAIEDLSAALGEMQRAVRISGTELGSTPQQTLKEACIRTVDRSLQAETDRRASGDLKLSEEQLERVRAVREQLDKL
jgi:hypothetical protein